jgi:hypothetical protein
MRRTLIITAGVLALVFTFAGIAQPADSDGDGIADPNDNCWGVVNPDQTDSDFDCPDQPFSENPSCGNACDGYCQYEIVGDINYDCRIDLYDFVLMSLGWLADCNSFPSDPACIQFDFDEDGWYLAVDCDDWNPDVHPEAIEFCDGLDNNCDGFIDEDFTDLGAACTVGTGKCQDSGLMVCTGDGTGTECSAIAGSPVTEQCDGLDNDCDGSTDENFPSLGDVCTVGTGICQDSGLMVCTGDGTGTECSAVAGSPVTEQCDGLDNDCDGSTDENFPSLGDVCTVGTGICQDSGLMVCTGDGTGTECSAVAGSPAVEQCDGLDNDCDGSTDEGGPWDDKGAACIVGTGICEAYGTKICDSESPSGPTVCSAIAGTPTPEVCNWLDDDCDGSTDEGGMWTDKGDVCSVGTGICQAYGIKVCDLGSPSGPTVCSAIAGTPTPEVCNWLNG